MSREISKNLDALSCEFSQIEFGGGSCLEVGLPPEKQKGYEEPDEGLLAALEPFLQNMEVADYGAGFGLYGQRWADPGAGIEYTAYDGAQHIDIVTHSQVRKMDLIYEQTLPTVNYVLCLNVGQHTPQYYQGQVMLNIARHAASGVIVAWGDDEGAWNPLGPAEVTAEFGRFGFELNPTQTSKFREAATSAFLKENLLVLDRVLEVEPEPDLGGEASEEEEEIALQREEAPTT